MIKRVSVVFLPLFVASMVSMPVLAQDVQLPLTWEGDGITWYMDDNGVNEVKFDFSMYIAENGEVSGTSTVDEETAVLKKMYYGVPKDGVRTLILVMYHEMGSDEYLYIMNGKIISGKLFYGDAMMMGYDEDSSVVKALNLNNSIATEVYDTYMPSSLKNALDEATLTGSFMIKGTFK